MTDVGGVRMTWRSSIRDSTSSVIPNLLTHAIPIPLNLVIPNLLTLVIPRNKVTRNLTCRDERFLAALGMTVAGRVLMTGCASL